MVNEVTQDAFSQLFQGEELRPHVARQVSLFVNSNDYEFGSFLDSQEGKIDYFLRQMERKSYAQREKTGREAAEDSFPLAEMHKGWAIRDQSTGEPKPIRSSKFALGTLYYFLREVPNPQYFLAVISELWSPEDYVFQRLYYSKYSPRKPWDDFDQISERFHAPSKDIRAVFRGIWAGKPLEPVQRVPLGKFELLLGKDETAMTREFETVAPLSLIEDKQPNVYAALNWRARLSDLHGRKKQIKRLIDWAQDGEFNPKLMLINGPGGVGKSRIIADVLSRLKDEHGWVGGDLPSQIREGDVIAADGEGVALVIDYPEENFDLVKQLVEACSNTKPYVCPVRIFLASREPIETWQKMLNKPFLANVSELSLETTPFLNNRDGKSVATEVAVNYATALKRPVPKLEGIDEWRDQSPSHSLPLMLVAATVHAVLDPSNAFTLSGKDLLLELARIELRRVRSYSKRNLNVENGLEKLLALAVLTADGLTRDTVYTLANKDICPGLSGAALLEAVQKTPYWRKSEPDIPGHLIRIQPDRPAAALLYLALGLDDETSPALPGWLGEVVVQKPNGFPGRLSRVGFDLAFVDAKASQQLEKEAISMIHLRSEMLPEFSELIEKKSSDFSAAFGVEVLERWLETQPSADLQGRILNALAIEFKALNDSTSALRSAERAVETFRRLLASDTAKYMPLLATALGTLAGRKLELGQSDQAQSLLAEQSRILRQLYAVLPEKFRDDLSGCLANASLVASNIGQHKKSFGLAQDALILFEEDVAVTATGRVADHVTLLGRVSGNLEKAGQFDTSIEISARALNLARSLAAALPQAHQITLAKSLANHANLLCMRKEFTEAAPIFGEVVDLFEILAAARPEIHRPDLAITLDNHANFLADVQKPVEALAESVRCIDIFRELASTDEGQFLGGLAPRLINHAIRLAQTDKHKQAFAVANEAVAILRKLCGEQPEVYKGDLARALETLSMRQAFLGEPQNAIQTGREAIEVYRALASVEPDAFNPVLAKSLGNFSDRAASMGFRREALEAAQEGLSLTRPLSQAYPAIYASHEALLLNTYAARLSEAGQLQKATQTLEEACEAYRRVTTAGVTSDIKYYGLALKNLADVYAQNGRKAEAYAKAKHALKLYREIMDVEDSIHLRVQYGHVLNTFAGRAADFGDKQSAIEHSREAVSVFQRLDAEMPGPHAHLFAMSLYTLADIFKRSGDTRNAVAPVRMAIEKLGPRFFAQPNQFAAWMKKSVDLYLDATKQLGREPDKTFLEPFMLKLVQLFRRQ